MSESSRRSATDSAHDILAAEAFAVPAPDPRLRHRLDLPGDPTGIQAPHDILAAEEFAMPAPEARGGVYAGHRPGGLRRIGWSGVAGAAVALLLWRRRRS